MGFYRIHDWSQLILLVAPPQKNKYQKRTFFGWCFLFREIAKQLSCFFFDREVSAISGCFVPNCCTGLRVTVFLRMLLEHDCKDFSRNLNRELVQRGVCLGMTERLATSWWINFRLLNFGFVIECFKDLRHHWLIALCLRIRIIASNVQLNKSFWNFSRIKKCGAARQKTSYLKRFFARTKCQNKQKKAWTRRRK